MANSGETDAVNDMLASLVLERQTNALSNFPIEIQKQILKCLDWKDLLNLRATNCNYNSIITNDVQDIWKLRHDSHWPNSKRYRKSTIAKSKGNGRIFKNLKKCKSNCCDTNLFFFVFIVVTTIFMIVDKTIF